MRNPTLLLSLCIMILAGFDSRPAAAFKCNVTVTSLPFGSYNIFSPTPLDSTANLSVDCNIPPQHPQAPLTVAVSLSPGNSGGFAQRWMQSAGPDSLRYNLYTTAAFSTIWGDGGGSSSILTGFAHRNMPFNATIYGRIPAQQNIRAGSYSDIITVAIDY
jgi:spore coat protein U-like protein